MNARKTIRITRSQLVPTHNRAEWLERHGVPEADVLVDVVADLRVWELVGYVNADGSVNWDVGSNEVTEAVIQRLQEDPTDRSDFDANALLSVVADQVEERSRTRAQETKAEEERVAAYKAKVAALTPDDVMDANGRVLDNLPDDISVYVRDALGKNRVSCGIPREVLHYLWDEQDRRFAAVKARRNAELCAWVTQTDGVFEPNVMRAAREGRDMNAAVITAIELRIEAVLMGLGLEMQEAYNFELDTRAPTERAYQIRDALVAALPALREAAALPDADIRISDFGRVDVCRGKPVVLRTALDLVVTHPWFPTADLGGYILTEPLNFSKSDTE